MSVIKDIIRKKLILFFVFDKSGSMQYKGKIVSLNEGIPAAINALRDRADELDVDIKIQVVTFNNTVDMMFERPIDLEDFSYTPLQANGGTYVGKALDKLLSTMSSNDAFRDEDETGFVTPAVIIASDGQPSDQYKEALEHAQQNKWWREATKIAMAVGDDADKNVLSDIVGGMDKVISITDLSKLKGLITAATLTTGFMAEQTLMTSDAKSSASADDIKNKLRLNDDTQDDEIEMEIYPPVTENISDSGDKWKFEDNGSWK